MPIDCTLISDLHGHYPSNLPGGDLLIICGDLTARDTEDELFNFFTWLHNQPYNKKIVIGGNHDNILQKNDNEMKELHYKDSKLTNIEYLCDSGTEFTYEYRDNMSRTIKIYGTPWTLKFPGQNPKAMAFTCDTEEELAEKLGKIPLDVDILVTHGPPYSILDECDNGNVGSKSLSDRVFYYTHNLQLHVFGHIHECGGKQEYSRNCRDKYISVNCSHVNEYYEPVNGYVRIQL